VQYSGMPDNPTFRDFVPLDVVVAPGVEELCMELEAAGWMPHGRWAERGLRYWPLGNRSRQFVVDLFYPINEHRLETAREQTGVAISDIHLKLKEEK